MLHVEFTQAPVPFAGEQAVVQEPQWAAFAVVAVSQPLAATPSQLPKPAAQVMLQTPAEQLGVPPVELQLFKHLPQFATLVVMSASQPLLARPSQSCQFPVHPAMVQAPPPHAPTPLAGAHLAPQDLQLLLSLFRLTSQPSERSPLQSA
jgi:hypothetical protein